MTADRYIYLDRVLYHLRQAQYSKDRQRDIYDIKYYGLEEKIIKLEIEKLGL